MFRLGGASFESRDDEEINNWHERLNVLWRNVGSPNVALWTQVIRRRASVGVSCGPNESGSIEARTARAADRGRDRSPQLIADIGAVSPTRHS